MITLPTIYRVACHTNNVGKGTIFVAIKGTRYNGIDYIIQALEQGAQTIVIEKGANLSDEIRAALSHYNAQLIEVDNVRKALGELSAQAYDYPAQHLKIIAVTGTKGKTTSTHILKNIFKHAGYKTACISTIGNSIADTEFKTELTTPHADYIQMFLHTCVQQGIEYVLMEVAAQAMSLYRCEGIAFDGLLFTNFSQEHGEFYETIDEYFAAKCKLFSALKSGAPCILNGDDERLKILSAKKCGTSFSFHCQADVKGSLDKNGQLQCITFSYLQKKYCIETPLQGLFNAYNCLGTALLALQCGVSYEHIKAGMALVKEIHGRMQEIQLPRNIRCFIDYAHNPSSFESVLSTLQSMSSYLTVVFGIGGNREQAKRPILGSIAARYADFIILTTDNPRFEDPATIIEHIKEGIPTVLRNKLFIELDRAQAIKEAFLRTPDNGTVALLGKGHEEYQNIRGEKVYFSEKIELAKLMT